MFDHTLTLVLKVSFICHLLFQCLFSEESLARTIGFIILYLLYHIVILVKYMLFTWASSAHCQTYSQITCFFCCRLKKDDFCEHGLKVVQHVIEQEGLVAFERMWRQHFLDTMQPAFLPVLWSVDHSHDELINMGLVMKEAVAANCLTADDLES